MPKLLFADAQLQDDNWRILNDDDALPDDGDIVVTSDRWEQNREALLQHPGQLGLSLSNTQAPAQWADDLQHFELVALSFPSFTDGRAYSQARELREKLNYQGLIRACGDVLRDQLFYMKRCGFDCFDFPANMTVDDIETALKTFSAHYQPQLKQQIPLAGVFAES